MKASTMLDGIRHFVLGVMQENKQPSTIWATWLAAESVDADLSQITLPNGDVITKVPRFNSASGFTAGDRILCLNDPGKPLIIMAIVRGDITAT